MGRRFPPATGCNPALALSLAWAPRSHSYLRQFPANPTQTKLPPLRHLPTTAVLKLLPTITNSSVCLTVLRRFPRRSLGTWDPRQPSTCLRLQSEGPGGGEEPNAFEVETTLRSSPLGAYAVQVRPSPAGRGAFLVSLSPATLRPASHPPQALAAPLHVRHDLASALARRVLYPRATYCATTHCRPEQPHVPQGGTAAWSNPAAVGGGLL